MRACTYRFTGPDGKEVTIVGKAEMQAYMVMNLDFFRSPVGEAQLGASLPEPAGATVEQAETIAASGMAPPLASRRASAARTWETPERIRRVLADEFGEEGIARLERAGFLRIVPDLDAVPAGLRIDGAEAVYDPAAGVAYLVADRLSADRAPAALLHELGEHHGLEGFVGQIGWRAIKAKISRLAADPASLSHNVWRAIKATYPEFEGMADADLARNDRFIHEVLAKLGESSAGRSQSLWLDLEGFIKRGLLRMGLTFLFGEHDVPALVAGSLRRLMRKGRKVSGVTMPARPMASIPLADALFQPQGRQAIRDRLGDLFHSSRTFNILHRTVGTQYHKAKVDPEHFGRVFNMAQQYIDDISRTANEAADVAPDLLPKMERMADAFKQLWHARADAKDAQALAAPIFEGTMNDKLWSPEELRERFSLDDRQIGLYQQFRAAVDRSLDELALSEMSRTAKMAKLQPAPREMNLRDALAFYMEQIEPDIEQIQGELAEMKERQKFEREQLEEAAQNGDSGADERRRYADLLESMKSRHAAESEALKVRIEDMAELLKATQGKVEQIEHLKATGYAPLMRFGQYTVDVFEAGEDGKPLKNADGEEIRHFFGMFENESEANEAARALREEYPNATINQGVMSQDSFRLFRGVTPETVEVFARMMGEEQSEVFQKYLKQAVNNRSALKRLIQRKGIAGFEKDPVRVLATFLTSNARATAANYHFGDMLRAASEIPKEKGDVKDEAIKLIDYIQNPGDEAASLRGLLFMHFLGGSVASAMVNMTQTFTMTLPYLAQFGGDVAGNLKEAMGIAGRRLFNKNAEVPEELKMALQRASDEGVVSPHEIHMLQGESMRTGWFQNNRYMRAFGKVWGSFFSLAEHFNRDVAFIAAYRSALQRNLSDEQAYEFAKDAVRETQGVYCVDTDTEILTAAGWKRFDQLEVGEQVFTVDMDGNLVHDALKNVHVFDGQHEVTEFRNANGFSMVVTDDHRNMVQNYNSRDKKWQRIRAVKTRDLKSGHFLLRAPLGDATGREQVYSDDQVRLMAWVAAEGHFFAHRNVKEKRGVGIVQSDNHNPMYVEEIDELLARLGGHFNRKVGKDYRKMVCWQLRKPLWMFIHEALPQKRVTMDLLSKLTVPQMRIFLETFTKADGTIPDVGGSSIGQKSVETLNTLQAMAVLSGQTSTLCERQKNLIEGGFRDYGSLYLAKNSIRAYLKECTKERRVVDTVWCPETHSGTWIARRNGRTFITGNSRANKPNWARGAVGATIFTFKQFSISYLEFLRRLPSRERAIALAVLWVFAGAAGMPFSDDLDDLIDTIAHMLGFAWDNKAGRRAFLTASLGRDAAGFIMNGVSAGLPLDISGRMGMANLLPGTALLDPAKQDKAREVLEFAGPAGSAIQTYLRGVDRLHSGVGSGGDVLDLLGTVAPIALSNAYKAQQMLQNGYAVDSKGRRVVDTDTGDAFSKALGFNPAVVAESGRAREEVFNQAAMLRDMKMRISERWADGIAHREPEKTAQAREMLARWNENNPDTPIRIDLAAVLRRARLAMMTAAGRTLKATPKELRQAAAEVLEQD